jgi:hypothetical protein
MADKKILETHNVNTMEREMKTQGCHLKEIKKKFLFVKENFDKRTTIVHVRTIEDKRHGVRSFKATEVFINGWTTGNRTEESYITGNGQPTEESEMTEGQLISEAIFLGFKSPKKQMNFCPSL